MSFPFYSLTMKLCSSGHRRTGSYEVPCSTTAPSVKYHTTIHQQPCYTQPHYQHQESSSPFSSSAIGQPSPFFSSAIGQPSPVSSSAIGQYLSGSRGDSTNERPAAGDEGAYRVWLIHDVTNKAHHQPISVLCSDSTRVLTGSLDHTLKVGDHIALNWLYTNSYKIIFYFVNFQFLQLHFLNILSQTSLQMDYARQISLYHNGPQHRTKRKS